MRHRRTHRLVAGGIATASAVTAGILTAPTTAQAVPSLPMSSYVVTDTPEWLVAPDIDVNPPGVVPGTVTAPPVERGYVITGDQLHRFDITGAPEAVAELQAFARRNPFLDTTRYRVFATPPILAAHEDARVQSLLASATNGELPIEPKGSPQEIANDLLHAAPVGTDPVDEQVEDGPLSDMVILPVDVGVGEVGAAFDEGLVKVTTALHEVAPDSVLTEAVTSVAAGREDFEPEWSEQSPLCYSRKSNATAWYDPCRQWASLAKDGDPNRRTIGHKQWGTAKSKGIYQLKSFNVKKRQPEDNPQSWLGWSPAADSEKGNCTSVSVGVNVNAAYLEKTAMQCDEWDISKSNPDVTFSNYWRGLAWRKERNVAAITAASVPNGAKVAYYVRYDYYAYPKPA